MLGTDVNKPHLIGVRLTQADKDKLDQLCAHTQRGPSDLVRILIRLAEPVHMPAVPIKILTDTEHEKISMGW